MLALIQDDRKINRRTDRHDLQKRLKQYEKKANERNVAECHVTTCDSRLSDRMLHTEGHFINNS